MKKKKYTEKETVGRAKKIPALQGFRVVPEAGLEPARPRWPKDFKSFVSTIPPLGHPYCGKKNPDFSGFRAKDGTRTRDPDLGKVVLYQLSYFRLLL